MSASLQETLPDPSTGNSTDGFCRFLVFGLDTFLYGLPLAAVERVVRVVEMTPLPKAPPVILGVIDMQGRIIPVADVRTRFGLPRRNVLLTDQFIIAHTGKRAVALLVDGVGDILTVAASEITRADEVLPNLDYVAGAVKSSDGTILIHDLDRFLSLEEAAELDAAWAAEQEASDAP